MRARLWRDGELIEEEIHTMRYEEYGMNELLLMLKQADFSEIQIVGDYSEAPSTADSKDIIFVARK
jgi:hypothetical protein